MSLKKRFISYRKRVKKMKIEVWTYRPAMMDQEGDISKPVKASLEVGEPFEIRGFRCGQFKARQNKHYVVLIQTGAIIGKGSSPTYAQVKATSLLKKVFKGASKESVKLALVAEGMTRNQAEEVPASQFLYWMAK